jgi:hypothetical protein
MSASRNSAGGIHAVPMVGKTHRVDNPKIHAKDAAKARRQVEATARLAAVLGGVFNGSPFVSTQKED